MQQGQQKASSLVSMHNTPTILQRARLGGVCASAVNWLVVFAVLFALFVVPAMVRARRRRVEHPRDAGIRVRFLDRNSNDRSRDR